MTDILPPGSSSSPSRDSSSCSPPLVSAAQDVGATVVSLASIGTITAAWFRGLLTPAPWWVPIAGIVLCGLPVNLRVRILTWFLPTRSGSKTEKE